MARSQLGVRSDVPLPLPLHMHAVVFVTGFVDDAMRNMVQSVNETLLQLVHVTCRFCIMSA